MKRKLAAVIVVNCIILMFCSCEASLQKELSERLIIEAIGIDREDGQYKITVQSLNTAGIPSSEEGGGTPVTQSFSASDKTVGGALAEIEVISGKEPLYSQARILVIGNEVAKNGLSVVLDYFTREYTTRNDILIAVSENTAEEIVTTENSTSPTAELIENSLLTGENNGLAAAAELYVFINSVLFESDCAACPVITVEKEEKKEEEKEEKSDGGVKIKVTGTMLFSGTLPVCTLTPQETQIMLLLTNETKGAVISIDNVGAPCVLKTIGSKTKVKTKTDGGGLSYEVTLSLECDITEYSSSIEKSFTKSELNKITESASDELCERTAALIKKTFYENNCDICRFGRRLIHKDRQLYEKYFGGKAGDFLSEEITCDIKSEVTIRRIGKEVIE